MKAPNKLYIRINLSDKKGNTVYKENPIIQKSKFFDFPQNTATSVNQIKAL